MDLLKYVILVITITIAFAIVVILPVRVENTEKAAEKAKESIVQKIQLKEADKYRGDLILVNNQNEYHFDPGDKLDLVKVYGNKGDFYQLRDTKIRLSARIVKPLNQMMDKFYNSKGLSTTVVLSGYRTKAYQEKLFNEDKVKNGEQHAREYIANAGYSEHHTGLAIDFGVQYGDGTLGSFTNSDNEKWIQKNSFKYGFVRRYYEDKVTLTGIAEESWHFRFVGLPHSYYISKSELCLEEYISFIQNNATSEFPITITYKDIVYSIYYTKESEITIPKEIFYTVSGDNQGGYIITTASKEQAFSVPPVNAISGSAVTATSGAVTPKTVTGSAVTGGALQ